jgi:hypothetical protein
MRVFVTQESNIIDPIEAEKFGEVHFLTANEFSPAPTSILNKVTLEEISRKMRDFDPREDRLLLAGDPVIIGICMHTAFKKGGTLRVLKWSKIHRKYNEITVQMGDKNEST